jgi:acyl-CoA dehydrogenase
MEELLLEPFRRMLAVAAAPEKVREAENTGDVSALWGEVETSGFLDALMPVTAGGAGLTLADVFGLVVETGASCLPVPLAETMVARALLAMRGATVPPDARIVMAAATPILPLARVATHALMLEGDELVLVKLQSTGADPFGVLGGVDARLSIPIVSVDADGVDPLLIGAALTAAKMAGAMRRVVELTLVYAGQRKQFGQQLGKFQAVQHQLAVMAEQVVSAKIAANIGMSGDNFSPLKVALAKCRTSEASHIVCDVAHAVHGAIGVTEEYDLQLLTRRLKEWQLAYGSEGYWASRIGAARAAQQTGTSADFVRLNLQQDKVE